MPVHYVNKENITTEVLNNIIEGHKGTETGFHGFDRLTGGLMKGQLYVIGGRPGMGKTAFALNLMENLAVHSQKKVVVYSLEHTAEQLIEKLIQIDAGISSEECHDPDRTTLYSLRAAAERISVSGLIVDDSITVDFAEKLEDRKNNELNDADAVIIDHLQLIPAGRGKRFQSRREETEHSIRTLKNIARTLNIPVIVLSQCGRMCEQRVDHRPLLSDLRDTGVIEECADVVAFIYRDEYYRSEDTECAGASEMIVRKNRFGRTGTARMAFSQDTLTFSDFPVHR